LPAPLTMDSLRRICSPTWLGNFEPAAGVGSTGACESPLITSGTGAALRRRLFLIAADVDSVLPVLASNGASVISLSLAVPRLPRSGEEEVLLSQRVLCPRRVFGAPLEADCHDLDT